MKRAADDYRFPHADAPMPLAQALDLLKGRLAPVTGKEEVPLRDAPGRILAEDVSSPRDVPPHDNSAVDGYAVYLDDLSETGETRLALTGRITAGARLDRPARPGEALRIFTGAPVPEGPDTVVMQEDCRIEGDTVVLPGGVKRGANKRFRGEDVKTGTVVLKAGRRLRPQDVAMAASVGRARLTVREPLRAAVFSTGNEVFDPMDEAPEGGIYDSNRYSVMALLDGLGCRVADLGILPDDRDAICEALAGAAPDHDLLMTSGGISVGDEDHVKGAAETLGSLHFWRLAIKPGRPIALGEIGGTAFVGLPGNPVAAMVTFMAVARTVVLCLSGREAAEPPLFKVRAGFDHDKKKGRREWLRGRLEKGGEDGPVVHKHPAGGSGILTSMVDADGLVELSEDQGGVREGDMVDFLSFSEALG